MSENQVNEIKIAEAFKQAMKDLREIENEAMVTHSASELKDLSESVFQIMEKAGNAGCRSSIEMAHIETQATSSMQTIIRAYGFFKSKQG